MALARSICALFLLLALASRFDCRSITLPSPQCRPGVVEQMSSRIQQICKALKAIREFSNVMENYLDERVLEQTLGLPVLEHQLRPESKVSGVRGLGVKRRELGDTMKKNEDVDHVFLHFGKRASFPF